MKRRPIPTRQQAGSGHRKGGDHAERLAVAALAFLADDPQRLGHFLALTGIEPAGIRATASNPAFLAGVMEYIGSDERLLLDFASNAGVDPADIERARIVLSGGAWERDTP